MMHTKNIPTRAVLAAAATLGLLAAAACSDAVDATALTVDASPAATVAAEAATAAQATATATPVMPTIAVSGAWTRSTAGNAGENSGGYAVVTNAGKGADRLVAVSVAPGIAEAAELHRTVRDGDMMRMEPVAGFDVAAGGSLTLERGGNHIMFLRLPAALRAGTRFPVTLRFERAGEVTVEFEVRDSVATAEGGVSGGMGGGMTGGMGGGMTGGMGGGMTGGATPGAMR